MRDSDEAAIVASPRIRRLFAKLAIILALVFAGSNLSSAIDQIQHSPGAPIAHQHLGLSDLSVASDHDTDHHAPAPDGDGSTDPVTGTHHHHHADSGSGVMAHMSALATRPTAATTPYAQEIAAPPPRLSLSGPKRPPRSSHIIA